MGASFCHSVGKHGQNLDWKNKESYVYQGFSVMRACEKECCVGDADFCSSEASGSAPAPVIQQSCDPDSLVDVPPEDLKLRNLSEEDPPKRASMIHPDFLEIIDSDIEDPRSDSTQHPVRRASMIHKVGQGSLAYDRSSKYRRRRSSVSRDDGSGLGSDNSSTPIAQPSQQPPIIMPLPPTAVQAPQQQRRRSSLMEKSNLKNIRPVTSMDRVLQVSHV